MFQNVFSHFEWTWKIRKNSFAAFKLLLWAISALAAACAGAPGITGATAAGAAASKSRRLQELLEGIRDFWKLCEKQRWLVRKKRFVLKLKRDFEQVFLQIRHATLQFLPNFFVLSNCTVKYSILLWCSMFVSIRFSLFLS